MTAIAHKRHRGAQPGNQNARKHGFYSQLLTPEQQDELLTASALDGLDREIAIARAKLRSILVNDLQNTKVLMLALSLLIRLVRTRQLIDNPCRQTLRGATAMLGRSFPGAELPLRGIGLDRLAPENKTSK